MDDDLRRHAPPATERRALNAGDLWAWSAGLIVLALAWHLSSVLLLVFAGALVALVLRELAAPLERRTRLPPQAALALVVIGLIALLGVAGWGMGAAIGEQLQTLRETLPLAWKALREWLASFGWGRWLIAMFSGAPVKPDDWQQVAGLFTGTLNATIGAIGALALVLVLGVYLAADVRTYRRGVVRLVPPAQRDRVAHALDTAAQHLSRWLLGQGVSMLAVGLMTAIGLAAIGMPLVVGLSLVAALFEFVPYFGPVATGVLVVAVALTRDEQLALWAALVCLAVQQLEGYVVQPLAQRWAVRLPPVLGIIAVLVFGLLFGLAGVLLAMPLMVASVALVEQLWLRPIEEPGADATRAAPAAPPRRRLVR